MIKPMDGYFIHLNSSTLKIALYNGTQPTKYVTEDLLPTAVSRSKIVDAHEFAKEFSRVLAQDLGETLPKLPLYFVLEPELTELFLLTTGKNNGDEDEHLMEQIKERLVDEDLDTLYFNYFKIAPFINQFVGIKKETLETFLNASREIGLPLEGVVPFGLLLPKTNSDISSLFVFPHKEHTTAVFSELSGISFAEKLDKKISLDELMELFWKLSIYNNKGGNLNIYSFYKNDEAFGNHKVSMLGNGDLLKDYEEIGLSKTIMETNPNIIESKSNLLNILPLPQVESSKPLPVVVMASVFSVLVVGGIILQLTVGFNNIFGKKNPDQNKQTVLAEKKENLEEPSEKPSQEEPAKPKKEVKRTDLKIRVENGNGVAGSAGKLKAYLEGWGYNVVEVGNSDKTDYPKTTVKLPKEFLEYKDLITNDLKTNYSVEVTNVENGFANYNVLIIAGQN